VFVLSDSEPINASVNNLKKFPTPTGSSFFCVTNEEIRITTTPTIEPVILLFKHLQFEALETKKISNNDFSKDLAYCHTTKVIGNTLLIAGLVSLAVLALCLGCLVIYCACCLGKELSDCCSFQNGRRNGYRSI
jgi:hypothetical protein